MVIKTIYIPKGDPKQEMTVFDGEVDPTQTYGFCHVENSADGGIVITADSPDEFGNESKMTISISKHDIDVMKKMGVL